MRRNYLKYKTVYAVDFDGTLCEDEFPGIGHERLNTIYFVRRHIQEEGDKWILWTVREGERLKEALEWLEKRGLHPDAVNDNLPELIEMYGNNPRKVAADYYIEDRALFYRKRTDKDFECTLNRTMEKCHDALFEIIREVL